MHSPTDASPPSLRTATHGLGPIGSLLLHRIGLAPTAHCRSPGALRKILYVIRANFSLPPRSAERRLVRCGAFFETSTIFVVPESRIEPTTESLARQRGIIF